MDTSHELLAGYPLVIAVPVLWGDEDSFGHVNNTVYLRWCETARVVYLMRAGMWPKLPPEGVGPILAAISCNYRKPVTHPDEVLIGARITRIGNSSMQMEHRIVSLALDAVVAEADSTLVMLDYASNRAVPVSEEHRESIGRIEGRDFALASAVER